MSIIRVIEEKGKKDKVQGKTIEIFKLFIFLIPQLLW
jgi:hypothetical protein